MHVNRTCVVACEKDSPAATTYGCNAGGLVAVFQ
jgi:hypothetical protein